MANANEYMSNVAEIEVTIASGQTVSSAAALYGTSLVAMVMPAALTGTAITFQGSADGSTFVAMYDGDGNALSKTVAASRWVVLDPADFVSPSWIKVVSGSAEAAERTITLLARPI